MKITVTAANLYLTPALNKYIQDKLGLLDKFLKSYEMESEIQLRVTVSRSTRHHHAGNVFRAEANLILPKHILRGVSEREDIRTAVNEIKKELRQEIEKHKQKLQIQDDKKTYRKVLQQKRPI